MLVTRRVSNFLLTIALSVTGTSHAWMIMCHAFVSCGVRCLDAQTTIKNKLGDKLID